MSPQESATVLRPESLEPVTYTHIVLFFKDQF
jgi:hypothetical protein